MSNPPPPQPPLPQNRPNFGHASNENITDDNPYTESKENKIESTKKTENYASIFFKDLHFPRFSYVIEEKEIDDSSNLSLLLGKISIAPKSKIEDVQPAATLNIIIDGAWDTSDFEILFRYINRISNFAYKIYNGDQETKYLNVSKVRYASLGQISISILTIDPVSLSILLLIGAGFYCVLDNCQKEQLKNAILRGIDGIADRLQKPEVNKSIQDFTDKKKSLTNDTLTMGIDSLENKVIQADLIITTDSTDTNIDPNDKIETEKKGSNN